MTREAPSISIITVTIDRPSLRAACASVDAQTHPRWHHYVLGDGVPPAHHAHPQRSTLGFSVALGAEEPGLNMPDGTPNPLQRWALAHLDLGDYCCFLDDDNLYRPEYLARMIAALEAAPDKGIALCGVIDRRHGFDIDGHPSFGRCDNSGFMARRGVVKAIPFPRASPDRYVTQDCEYIVECAARFGWIQVPERLVVFGAAPDTPPDRRRIKLVRSWERPMAAGRELERGGDPGAAIEVLKAAAEADASDAWSLWKWGEACLVGGDREGARARWAEWLERVKDEELRHDWLVFQRSLAERLIGCGELDLKRAIEMVEARCAASEWDHEARLNRAFYRELAGESESDVPETSEALRAAMAWRRRVVGLVLGSV